jgi:hypothetical protein
VKKYMGRLPWQVAAVNTADPLGAVYYHLLSKVARSLSTALFVTVNDRAVTSNLLAYCRFAGRGVLLAVPGSRVSFDYKARVTIEQ